MTSLVGWIGVDSRGPASVYLATDSRLSKPHANWDSGRKVFACSSSADIFAYCGAVLFPSQVLGQLTESIDAGTSFPTDATPQQRLETFVKTISDAVSAFPERDAFTIVYATRDDDGFGASFLIAAVTWEPIGGISKRTYSVPNQSDLLFAYGSGKPSVEECNFKWRQSDVGRTSRAVFSAFCDAVASGKDQYTGGAPQLVGIYLRGPSHTFGIFYDGQLYLNGMHAYHTHSNKLECRNNLFECCDANGNVVGQKHSRPRNCLPNRVAGTVTRPGPHTT